MKLSEAQIAVLANLENGCGLVTSESFSTTHWSLNGKQPKMDFVLPATARKLHNLGLISRRTGRGYEWNSPNTFITDKGREYLRSLNPETP